MALLYSSKACSRGGHTWRHFPRRQAATKSPGIAFARHRCSSICALPSLWILHLRTQPRADTRVRTEPQAHPPGTHSWVPARRIASTAVVYRGCTPRHCEHLLLHCAPAARQCPIGDAAPARLIASPAPSVRAGRRQLHTATYGTTHSIVAESTPQRAI